jgi:hypothetical protein
MALAVSPSFQTLWLRFPEGRPMNEITSLSSVLFPRQRELRRLENLLVEARQNFQEVARKGEDEVDERDNVSDLMTSLARIKAVVDYIR